MWTGPFKHLFFAQTATTLADNVFMIAITWIFLKAHNPSGLAVILFGWGTVRGFFMLLGGTVVDRYDKRILGVVTGLGLTVMELSLTYFVATTNLHVVLWLVGGVILGLLDGIRLPLASALMPDLVAKEYLLEANRLWSIRTWSLTFVGPSLGGFLLGMLGNVMTFLLVGLFYALGAIWFFFLPKGQAPEQASSFADGWLLQLREGFSFVLSHPTLRVVIPWLSLGNFFVLGPMEVAVPMMLRQSFHVGAIYFGFFAGLFALGLLVGTFLVKRFTIFDSILGFFALMSLGDLCTTLASLTTSLFWFGFFYFWAGLLIGPGVTFYQTFLQQVVPETHRGRVFGIVRALGLGLQPLSVLLTGFVLTNWSGSFVLALGGTLAVLMDLIGTYFGWQYGRYGD